MRPPSSVPGCFRCARRWPSAVPSGSEAQQRRKAVELLLEKKADKVRQKAQRQEQKMLDDYAIQRRYHQSGL